MQIQIFGDSHASSITRKKVSEINGFKIHNHFTAAATIRGLVNENSTLRYGTYIPDVLKNNSDNNTIIILKFGQVDIEYSYHFKTTFKKENIVFDKFCEETIKIYDEFINKIKEYPHSKIIICSPNLPSYATEPFFRIYLKIIFGARFKNDESLSSLTENEINSKIDELTLKQQTMNVLNFNDKLKDFCKEKNLIFFDTIPDFIDPSTGLLDTKYVGIDNHYTGVGYEGDDGLVQEIFQKKLFETIKNILP